jgi:anti-sigma B factor antagonist
LVHAGGGIVSDPVPGAPFGAGAGLHTAVTRPRPDALVLAVEGEVDTLTAPRLEADLDEALHTATNAGTVVADLTGVTFLSSSGLAVLIQAARRAAATGVPLRLVAVTRAVTRPLTVTGADVLFDIHADVASALAATRPAPADIAPPPGGGGR